MSINNILKSELDFFIKGNVTLEKLSEYINPISWLSTQNWKDIVKLTKEFPEVFPNLDEHVKNNNAEWLEWYNLDMPESSDPPDIFNNLPNPFHKLMLLRCFRVDRIYQAISNYIESVMGNMYITTPFVDYDEIYAQTNPKIPGLFILSPGSDPTGDLMKLANRYGVASIQFLSLGQGQEAVSSFETKTSRVRR